jgi:hypothetical protein
LIDDGNQQNKPPADAEIERKAATDFGRGVVAATAKIPSDA